MESDGTLIITLNCEKLDNDPDVGSNQLKLSALELFGNGFVFYGDIKKNSHFFAKKHSEPSIRLMCFILNF